jgi:hypothetical protein
MTTSIPANASSPANKRQIAKTVYRHLVADARR